MQLVYKYSKWTAYVSLALLTILTIAGGVISGSSDNFSTVYNDKMEPVMVPASADWINPTFLRLGVYADKVLTSIAIAYFGARIAANVSSILFRGNTALARQVNKAQDTQYMYDAGIIVVLYCAILALASILYIADGGMSASPGTILEPLPSLFNSATAMILLLLGAGPGTRLVARLGQ